MRPPFPGMDPWLEHPALGSDVHNSLIAAMRDALSNQLPGHYYVSLEERMVLAVPWDEPRFAKADLSVAADQERDVAPAPREADPAVQEGVVVLDVDLPIGPPIRETFLEIHDARDATLITVIEILSPSNKRHRRARRIRNQTRGDSGVTHEPCGD